MRTFLIALALAAGPAAGADNCEPRPVATGKSLDRALQAGSYDLTLIADCGPRRGSSVKRTLELRPTRAREKSPLTGAIAVDAEEGREPLYGWLDGDLKAVDAPLCTGAPHPEPTSRDPVAPGVLVIQTKFQSRFRRPPDAPILLVGTLGNLRADRNYRDGCGIGLHVQNSAAGCYEGSWDGWGTAHAGTGRFTLCRPKKP